MDKHAWRAEQERLENGLMRISQDTADELEHRLSTEAAHATTREGQDIYRTAYETYLGIRERLPHVSDKAKCHDWSEDENDDPYRRISLLQAWLLAETAACEQRKETGRAKHYYRLLRLVRDLLGEACRKRENLFNEITPSEEPWKGNKE